MNIETVDRQVIEQLLPHREPFLFVDKVRRFDVDTKILAERCLRDSEPQFAGHFPGNPIMPGVLVTEALAQTAGLLLALSAIEKGEHDAAGRLFYLAKADMKWTHPARPGDLLQLEARLKQSLGPLVLFSAKAYTKRHDVAAGTLALARVDRPESA
jgi:3-hydroxymyristoyl/3-hydroxydecanoyl-(acyl carrier protein) dehydratase